MKKPNDTLKAYWRSVDQQSRPRLTVLGQSGRASDAEFGPGADELVVSGQASRRKFMGILGASSALAGLSSGCIRKPVENILPYSKRPEDVIPGNALFYATAIQIGSSVQGLLVETHEGRPTKVEGNPLHPASKGRTDAFAQASVLNLYDPDRSRAPWSKLLQAQLVLKEEATEEQAKELVINKLCADLYEHVLAETKSADRARALSDQCKFDATEGGKAQVKISTQEEEGETRKVAEVALASEEQAETTWELAWHQLDELFGSGLGTGAKVAFVVRDSRSPAYQTALSGIRQRLNQAKFYVDDPGATPNMVAAGRLLGGDNTRISYSVKDAKIIAAFDSDFLGMEEDRVRLSAEWAEGRRVADERSAKRMSRMYAIEPHFTPTGAAADHRLAVKGADVVNALTRVAQLLASKHKLAADENGGAVPAGAIELYNALSAPAEGYFGEDGERYLQQLAADLARKPNRGKAAVLVGERQPPLAHALAALINGMVGSLRPGGAMSLYRWGTVAESSIEELAADLEGGRIDTVICLGTNPAYDAAGDLAMADKLSKARLVIHAGTHRDETGRMATWHLPVSHAFESWGDLISTEGTMTVTQPLVEPLHGTPSLIELAVRIAQPGKPADGLEFLRQVHARGDAGNEKAWRKWLHTGVGSRPFLQPADVTGWANAAKLLAKVEQGQKGWEVNFHHDPKLLDGLFSNNGWMQELPHPMSKLTWDNAAYINPADAEAMGIQNGDNLAIRLGDRSMSLPAWISPGQARKTISVTLGYGRNGLGSVAEGAGFDTYKLRSAANPYFEFGTVDRGAGHYLLVSAQDYGSLDPDGPEGKLINYEERPIYRETTVAGFAADPDFSKKGDLMPPERIKSLWEEPKLTGKQQWGMSIDLNLCSGCNTCTVACNSENNIPVVGKTQVANGRELHWIRIDRYYRGYTDMPQAVVQPVGCQHCETAPCENVCPVQATAHSPEGLNDMAYNRCVGTRYCANNCPYKVRRFNFFNFNLDIDPLEQMQKNPDVTVRFRGVIEKCSYCVQRIQGAKIEAHAAGRDTVADGIITTACEQACPTGAITFGDVADETTRVAQLKKNKRDYGLLTDLNTKPRTSYLARVRNPNPALEKGETKEG